MTVIAYCGNYLVADKQATLLNTKLTVTKLHQIDEYSAVAFAGGATNNRVMLDWFRNGRNPKKWPGELYDKETPSTAILVDDGQLYLYEGSPYPIEVEDEFCAFGSGAEVALGLLHAGRDALEAVARANELNIYCGGGMDYYKIERRPRKKSKK